MAVTALMGFEVGALSAEPTWVGAGTVTPVDSTEQARTGARSAKCAAGSGQSSLIYPSGSPTTGWCHFGVYISALPSTARFIAGNNSAGGYVSIRLNTDGTLSYLVSAAVIGTSTAALAAGGWYWVGYRVSTSASSVVCLQIDGSDAVSGTPGTITASVYNFQLGVCDTVAAALTVYIDDIVIDDAGFLAPSKVALLVPISDNYIDTNEWKRGDATDGTMYEAVNNIPPAGVASASESATTNIEAISNGGGGGYRANLTTYATAGVASGDTVIAFQEFIRHGEDINTGTKTGNFLNNGNPDRSGEGATSFVFGDDGGAHAAETGVWKTLARSILANPSVTLNSSPVLTVNRISESRVGCVDFMGAYVAWTPASGPPTTDAPAELATATGAALAPARTEVAVFAPLATSTGAALVPSVVSGKFVDAGLATATGAALTPTVGVGKVAGLATATGSALAATAVPERRVAAGQATATGTALAPTARPEARAPAGLATATGAALGPVAAVAVFGPLATATGAALTITVTVMENVRPTAGLATATGAALAGIPAVASFASTATAAGTALVATVSIQEGVTETKAYPDVAAATGSALTATVLTEARASAGLATATGAALTPTARPEARAGAGLAVSTGSALAPTASIAPFAATATATGAALTATATPTQFVYVDALTATAAGSALAPSTYAPVWVSPSDGTQMSETPVLVFTMPTMASAMHFHLQLDTASSFDTGSLREAKTSADQTGWTYWDGGTWQAVPSGGVPAIYGGNQARYAVSSPLSGGTWYRRVRAGT